MATCVSLKLGTKTIVEGPVEELKSLEDLVEDYNKTVGQLPPTLSHLADDALTNFNRLIDGAIQEAIISRDF